MEQAKSSSSIGSFIQSTISNPDLRSNNSQQSGKTESKDGILNGSSASRPLEYKREAQWQKGCEQHLSLSYKMEAAGPLEFIQNEKETDGIAWFTLSELENLEMFENIRAEIKTAFML